MSQQSSDDYLDAIFHDALRTRDNAWAAFVANLNRLSEMLGSQRRFAADFGHLVPAQQQRPLAAEAPGAPTEMPTTPPPLPEGVPYTSNIPPPGAYDEAEAAAAFQQRFGLRRAAAAGDNQPGLDGVLGGRR